MVHMYVTLGYVHDSRVRIFPTQVVARVERRVNEHRGISDPLDPPLSIHTTNHHPTRPLFPPSLDKQRHKQTTLSTPLPDASSQRQTHLISVSPRKAVLLCTHQRVFELKTKHKHGHDHFFEVRIGMNAEASCRSYKVSDRQQQSCVVCGPVRREGGQQQ